MRAAPKGAPRGAPRRRSKVLATVVAVTLLLVLALGPIPYLHARRMTHFVADGSPTPSPAELSALQKVRTLLTGVRVPRPRNDSDPRSVGLEFTTITLRTLDGVRLEAWSIPTSSAGATDLVVLFHGHADSKESLLQEAREFHKWGADVLLVDFRGSGGSEGDRTSLGWYEANDVEAAWRRATESARPRRVILYGASMGAVAICRAISALGVQPDAVILEAPFNRMLDTTANRFRQMGLPAFPLAHALVFWGGWQHDFDAFAHAPEEYISKVECPALLLFGEDDPDVTVRNAQALVTRAGPLVRHRILAGAGHPRLFRQKSGQWRDSVTSFLEALP